jgi:hypothetical protein
MVLYARDSVRMLISKSGCEVASCLLALDLVREGHRPVVVTGYFVRDAKRTPHTWVEVEGRILDPTQEQFSIPPEAEANAECYVERTGSLTERAEIEAFLNGRLVCQAWNEGRRRLIEDVAHRHDLLIATIFSSTRTPSSKLTGPSWNASLPSRTQASCQSRQSQS